MRIIELREVNEIHLVDYFLVQFIVNGIFAYSSIRRLLSEILAVRNELLHFQRQDNGARHVLVFYEKLGSILPFVGLQLFFFVVFTITLNVCYAFIPKYAWPFYTVTMVSYPLLGVYPIAFWYSGGKGADAFADDFETSAHTGLSLVL